MSNCKGDEKVVFIKLKTTDDKKVKEMLSRKKNKLNEDIVEIARIDDVLIGCLILKLIFNDIGNSTQDTYCRLEKVLQTILSEQTINGYLENGNMTISVTVTDRHEFKDVDNDDLLNKKLSMISNLTSLLEELDAITFIQDFVDNRIMSREEFECQFRVKELSRKSRTSLLLKYVLTNKTDVMNVFLNVIEKYYSCLEESLKKRKFIGYKETEAKQYKFVPRKAVQQNDLSNSPELDFSSILSPTSDLSIDNNAKATTLKKPERIIFVNGLGDELQQSAPDQFLQISPISSFDASCQENISKTYSCNCASGPEALLLDQNTPAARSLPKLPSSGPMGMLIDFSCGSP